MEKMDRRVRKTRALLLQGLVKMLETHDIQDISVKELTELVDINRSLPILWPLRGRCWNSSVFWTETGIWPRS